MHWQSVAAQGSYEQVRDLSAQLDCAPLGLLHVYVPDAGDPDLLTGMGRYEAFAYALRSSEIGVGSQETPCLLRNGSWARIVDDRPVRTAANYHSEILVFWHPVPASVPAAVACGHVNDAEPRGPARSAGSRLGAAVSDLRWIGLREGGRVRNERPADGDELLVVTHGEGVATIGDEESPLRAGSFACRTAGSPPLKIAASSGGGLHLLSYRALTTN
jgi:quercetin dioxygenase-like cupin family protein